MFKKSASLFGQVKTKMYLLKSPFFKNSLAGVEWQVLKFGACRKRYFKHIWIHCIHIIIMSTVIAFASAWGLPLATSSLVPEMHDKDILHICPERRLFLWSSTTCEDSNHEQFSILQASTVTQNVMLTRLSPNVYWLCRTSWGLFLLARIWFWDFYWPGAIGSLLASSPDLTRVKLIVLSLMEFVMQEY